MQNWYPLQGRNNLLKAFALMMGLAICGSSFAQAQLLRPKVPQLSLISRPNPNSTGNGTNYPDDRIYVPKAINTNTEPREILVPVFIKNCFLNGIDPRYNAAPIYSFRFKVQYDSRVFKAVGLERFGPLPSDTNSLAREFDLSFDDSQDSTYQTSLGVSTPNRFFGRRVRIAGASTKPLPPTRAAGQTDPYDQSVDCDAREFQELLYIRFRVIGSSSGVGVTNTPIIITNDSLRYNDLNVSSQSPFPGTSDYPTPAPGDLNVGLAGLDRLSNPAEPTKPGVIYAVITDVPRFSFLPNVGLDAKVKQITETLWELTSPIVVEDGATINPALGGRGTQSINVIADPSISFTRLTDISVESSSKWLKFLTIGAKNPIPSARRFGEIDYIDNGILGPGGPGFQNADQTVTTQKDPLLNFRIVVDPNELDPQVKDDLDATGIYVGYITFRSASAEFSPVRLKVTYINVRRPNEPNNTNAGGTGIRFDITRIGAGSVTAKLLIGTGLRATAGVDTLFGEFAYPDPQNTSDFSARLYSTDPNVVDHLNGLGDLTGTYQSRDIRSSTADDALIYKVRFQRGAGFTTSQVTITYDTQDFPPAGQLFIRDTLNGTRFSFDLRTAGTGIGGTRRSITINDAAINSFIIEYTIPKVIGYPVTRRGWNLLSLPVRPSSTSWDDIYPNRLTEQPIIYSKGIYQDAAVPKVGVGYFVRFGAIIDSVVAGTRISRIDARDEVIITTGWNTIGSLSVPVNIDRIQFDPAAGQPLPRRTGGVYGYTTDRGYVEISELVPGLGYWVKVTEGVGYLKLIAENRANAGVNISNSEVYASSTKISIADGVHTGAVYIANPTVSTESFELPPLPPAELFDVRFTNNSSVATGNAAIRIQGADYPVNVAIENTNAQYTVVNAATGEIIGVAGRGAGVQITDKKVNTIKLLQASSGVANFDVTVSPNPVSNQATITYSLPSAGTVSVKVFNALGQEVQTLVNGPVAGATQELTFNASALPSGQYLVKFVAGETVIVRTITVNH